MTSFLLLFNLLCLTQNEVKIDTAATCNLKSYSYDDVNVSYVYDEQGRPLVISKIKTNGSVLASERYIYKADSIEHTIVHNDGDLVVIDLFRLNDMGLVESGTSTWISNKNSTSVSQYVYEYDSEGYLIHKVGTRNNQIAYEGHFFYENGNLTKEYSMTGEILYEYYLDRKSTRVANYVPFGKGNQNLLRGTDHSKEGAAIRSGAEKIEYSYEFDAFGNVIKEIQKGYWHDKTVDISETEYMYDRY